MENKIERIIELDTYIESLQTERDMLQEDVINSMKSQNMTSTEHNGKKVSIEQSVRYKYSEDVQKLEDIQKERVKTVSEELSQEITDLKEYEKKTGIAVKLLGEPKLKIK